MLNKVLELIRDNSTIYTYGRKKEMTPALFVQRESANYEQIIDIIANTNNAKTVKEFISEIRNNTSISKENKNALINLINRIAEETQNN